MKESSLLIVVDMINGFVKEGALHDIHINSITPNIIKLIEEHKGELVFVRDSHDINCEEFKEYPVHCLKGSHESELIDELKVYEGFGKTFLKNTTNAMNEIDFRNYIDSLKELREIIVTGCCTDICVYNLINSLLEYRECNKRNFDITLYSDCVDTFDSPVHNREKINKEIIEELSEKVLIKKVGR